MILYHWTTVFYKSSILEKGLIIKPSNVDPYIWFTTNPARLHHGNTQQPKISARVTIKIPSNMVKPAPAVIKYSDGLVLTKEHLMSSIDDKWSNYWVSKRNIPTKYITALDEYPMLPWETAQVALYNIK